MAAGSAPDYYALLGVPRQASASRIEAAYRQQAARLGNSREDQHRLNQLIDAYNILRDPELRAAYDAKLPRKPLPTVAQMLGLTPRKRKNPNKPQTLTQLMDFDWEAVEEEEAPDSPSQRKARTDELWFKALVIAVVLGVVGLLFWLAGP